MPPGLDKLLKLCLFHLHSCSLQMKGPGQEQLITFLNGNTVESFLFLTTDCVKPSWCSSLTNLLTRNSNPCGDFPVLALASLRSVHVASSQSYKRHLLKPSFERQGKGWVENLRQPPKSPVFYLQQGLLLSLIQKHHLFSPHLSIPALDLNIDSLHQKKWSLLAFIAASGTVLLPAPQSCLQCLREDACFLSIYLLYQQTKVNNYSYMFMHQINHQVKNKRHLQTGSTKT